MIAWLVLAVAGAAVFGTVVARACWAAGCAIAAVTTSWPWPRAWDRPPRNYLIDVGTDPAPRLPYVAPTVTELGKLGVPFGNCDR